MMPYISKEDREALYVGERNPLTPGELNFVFTTNILDYIEDNGLSYSTISDIVSSLENAKLEFYRRVAAPYEDSKIQQNGDVY